MIFLWNGIVYIENSSQIFKTSIKCEVYQEIHCWIDVKETVSCSMSDSPIFHPTLKSQHYQYHFLNSKICFISSPILTFALFASSSENWILQTISWTSEKILGKWQTRKTVTIVKETLIFITYSCPEYTFGTTRYELELTCLRNDIKTKRLRTISNPIGIM